MHFFNLEMSGTTFSRCEMSECDFGECKLTEADFSGLDLTKCRFQGCDLTKASFVEAVNYVVDPNLNQIKGAKFSYPGVLGLLEGYGVEVV